MMPHRTQDISVRILCKPRKERHPYRRVRPRRCIRPLHKLADVMQQCRSFDPLTQILHSLISLLYQYHIALTIRSKREISFKAKANPSCCEQISHTTDWLFLKNNNILDMTVSDPPRAHRRMIGEQMLGSSSFIAAKCPRRIS